MIFTEIKDITIPFLHDAAYVLSLRTDAKGDHPFKLKDIYVDPSGECAISYWGLLSVFQIKELMVNYCYPYEDKSMDEIDSEQLVYCYSHSQYLKGEKNYTTIYTPDNLDYRHLKTENNDRT